MATFAMPFVVANMGCEMLYVLSHRLKAQKIVGRKAERVLSDLVEAMFAQDLFADLFSGKHQDVAPRDELAKLFHKVVHSGIMKLNDTSFSKLLELMTMGCKYSFCGCSGPYELWDVTYNHLESVKLLCTEKAPLIDDVQRLFEGALSTISFHGAIQLRRRLLNYFQDRRVRVSHFLQSGMQHQSGAFIFPKEIPVAHGASVPGTVTTRSGETRKFDYAVAVRPRDENTPRTRLGCNLFDSQVTALSQTKSVHVKPEKAGLGASFNFVPATPLNAPSSLPTAAPKFTESTDSAAQAEIDLLVQLVGVPSDGADDEIIPITGFGALGEMSEPGEEAGSISLTIDASGDRARHQATLESTVAFLDTTATESVSAGLDDDLLDLAGL
jgi:Organic solute transport protein 1